MGSCLSALLLRHTRVESLPEGNEPGLRWILWTLAIQLEARRICAPRIGTALRTFLIPYAHKKIVQNQKKILTFFCV
jgi:hypothetical protein